ncbi:MAG: hypothetical protein QGH51_03410 [Planctomycetota bacterium]|jgi:hypothetical protein|nr:hypothetical protein [Planctomycetota bacterium]MDP6941054.1 hypothetical protein [Planctomycetota bacterium]
MKKLLFFAAIYFWMVSAPLCADILILKDGRVFDAIQLETTDGGYVVKYEHGDLFVPSALVESVVLESGDYPAYEPVNQDEEAKLAKGLVPFRGKWMSPKKREKKLNDFIEEQRAAIKDYEKHSVWRDRYKIQTKYFNFEHTLPPHVFERYSKAMEAYFSAFCKEWKVKPQRGYAKNPKDTRLLVCFYSNRPLFHQVSGASPNTLGYFRFVKPLELNIYYDRIAPEDSTEVMFHEANHYLQKLINVEFSYPHFPGEALAEFYGASHWDEESEKLESGLILEGRLTEVQTDIAKGEMMSLEKMLTTRMYEHYTWGWTFVHFLLNDKRYAKNFKKFFVGLAKDKKVKREHMGVDGLKTVPQEEVLGVFMRFMKIKDMDALREMEKEWHQYIQDELEVTSSVGLEKAAENALRHGRKIRARRLYQETIDTGEASARAHHRFALFVLDTGTDKKNRNIEDVEEEKLKLLGLWRKAVELDPMTGQYHAALGYFLKATGELEEGGRLIRLADDIGPKDENAKLLTKLRRMLPLDIENEDAAEEKD